VYGGTDDPVFSNDCASGEQVLNGVCDVPAAANTAFINQMASNLGGADTLLGVFAAAPAVAAVGTVAVSAVAGLAGVGAAAGTAAAGAVASPQWQGVILNIGGAFEGPANAIILQTGQVSGSTAIALQNATEIAAGTGQQVVMGLGNSIPFASGSVGQVIINNSPVGFQSGIFGPWIDPTEIIRILAPGGTVTLNGTVLTGNIGVGTLIGR
jgi:hypothetical protein